MNSSTAWRAISLSGVPWRFRDGRRLNQSDKIASKILVLVCPSAWLCMVSQLTWKSDRFSSMNFSISLSSRLKRGITLDMVTGTTLFAQRLVQGSPTACFFFRNLGDFRHRHRGFAELTLKNILAERKTANQLARNRRFPALFCANWSIFTQECFAAPALGKRNQTAFAHDRMIA
jgi:hypothetical protein